MRGTDSVPGIVTRFSIVAGSCEQEQVNFPEAVSRNRQCSGNYEQEQLLSVVTV